MFIAGLKNRNAQVEILFLSMSQVEDIISYKEVLNVLDEIYKAWGKGQIINPGKTPMHVDAPSSNNFFISMQSLLRNYNVAGIKWLSAYYEQQRGSSLKSEAIIVLNHTENGRPFAVMDGTIINFVRTGAHSAIAAKYLAKKHSRTIAMIGCGIEARTHLAALKELFHIEVIKAYDINEDSLKTYKREVESSSAMSVTLANSAKEAVEEADIVCVLTTAQKPVVFEPWIPAGCFVTGLMGFLDLDPACGVKADKWVVGDRDGDKHRQRTLTGDVIDFGKVYADMGEIATGAKPGRQTDQERIVYTCFGMAAFDVGLAYHVYNEAVKKGYGIKVRL